MSMPLEISSPCKVNLILNILGKREDGFHELETIMHPVNLCDRLNFALGAREIQIECNQPDLPTGPENMVHRAAAAFLKSAGIRDGVRIHLEKNIPLAAGLGGGSGNAALTLVGLNELFGHPLPPEELQPIAASLGSDIPFFLQSKPALATGRGEIIKTLDCFSCLEGAAFLLVYPGFGVSTAWTYQQLARFPDSLNGRAGRAEELAAKLHSASLAEASAGFYNSLEAPVLEKYPLLAMLQEFLRASGAAATLMSGSGSTTFAILKSLPEAQALEQKVQAKFGPCWTTAIGIAPHRRS